MTSSRAAFPKTGSPIIPNAVDVDAFAIRPGSRSRAEGRARPRRQDGHGLHRFVLRLRGSRSSARCAAAGASPRIPRGACAAGRRRTAGASAEVTRGQRLASRTRLCSPAACPTATSSATTASSTCSRIPAFDAPDRTRDSAEAPRSDGARAIAGRLRCRRTPGIDPRTAKRVCCSRPAMRRRWPMRSSGCSASATAGRNCASRAGSFVEQRAQLGGERGADIAGIRRAVGVARSDECRGLELALVGPMPPPAGGHGEPDAATRGELLGREGAAVTLVQVNSPYRPACISRRSRASRAHCFVSRPMLFRLWRVAGRVDIMHIMANSGWSWHLCAAPAVWIAAGRRSRSVVNYRGGEAETFLAPIRCEWLLKTLRGATALAVPSGFLKEVFGRRGVPSVSRSQHRRHWSDSGPARSEAPLPDARLGRRARISNPSTTLPRRCARLRCPRATCPMRG